MRSHARRSTNLGDVRCTIYDPETRSGVRLAEEALKMIEVSRRALLITTTASLAMPRVAHAAEPEYRLKFGNIVSGDHPLNTSMGKARDKILQETEGKVSIEIFPKS